tara:strand:- start:2748 stop:2987 length:240 start_codon:yes stop_codon:yes gene_type:complete
LKCGRLWREEWPDFSLNDPLLTLQSPPTPPQEIHGNRWALVAAELPGKTGQQCAQRWRHKVNPAIKKEKWTPEEDAQVS